MTLRILVIVLRKVVFHVTVLASMISFHSTQRRMNNAVTNRFSQAFGHDD